MIITEPYLERRPSKSQSMRDLTVPIVMELLLVVAVPFVQFLALGDAI